MKDQYDIIDSLAIRNYSKEINYKMNSIERSWFIYRSKNMDNKIKLYQDIIDNYEDISLNDDWINDNDPKTIHELLKEYIKILNYNRNINYNIFNKEEVPIEQFEIEKIFESMYFNFPNPFKPGDILYCKRNQYFEGGPFVYTQLDSAKDDPLQMVGYGYTQVNGTLYHDCIGIFTDFDFYTGNLSNFNELLNLLNLHIKGKIDYKVFLNVYKNLIVSNISLICKNNEDQYCLNYYNTIKGNKKHDS